MAGRKRTINRKEQRGDYEDENEKAEEEENEDEDEESEDEEEGDEESEGDAEAEDEGDEEVGDEDDEDAPKKKKKAKAKKAVAPKRTRTTKKVVRQKAVWIIFDNSSKELERFPYNEKPAAEKFLADKSEDKKGLYLQMVKVPLDEK